NWSPDNPEIAFDDGKDVFSINSDGSARAKLTNGTVPAVSPAWSPDGTKIAFQGTQGVGSRIYVMSADGSHATPLFGGFGQESSPDWGPFHTLKVNTTDDLDLGLCTASHCSL